MGIFDKLNRFIYTQPEDESPPVAVTPVATAAQPKAAPAVAPRPPVAPPAPQSGSGDVSDELKGLIQQRVDEAAEPAYSAFKRLEATLAGIITDGRTRTQAVIASITAQGQTTRQLVIDLEECDSALVTIRGEIDDHFNGKIAEEVTAKETQAQQAQDEITRLQTQIAELGQKIIGLRGEASSSQIAIEAERGASLRYVDQQRYDLGQVSNMITPHATPAAAPVNPNSPK